MIQTARRLLLGLAGALAISASALAQETSSLPRAAPPTATVGEGILQSLPKPPDLPASLFAPAPPPAPAHSPLDVAYFVPDPLLDAPPLPPPGCFAGLDLDVLKPHLRINAVRTGNETVPGFVPLPAAPLDWAASPRVFLGYRLPSGFGEVAVAYRGLATRGSEGVLGSDGPAALTSRLTFNVVDLDYSSREISLWPDWDMKWTVGARALFLFFDSQADQPLVQAAAGSGTLQRRESTSGSAIGTHAGLELARRVADTGLAVTLRTDFTTNLNRVRERAASTFATPGAPAVEEARSAHWWNTPILSARIGVSWQPPAYPAARFFLGYQYEYWWRVGGNLDTGGRADLWDQGVVLQAAFRF